MYFRWPFVSRGRFEDAQTAISALTRKSELLEAEVRRLANEIMLRHGIRPVFDDPAAKPPSMVAVAPPVEQKDPLTEPAQTLVRQAQGKGARSAREICAVSEAILAEQSRNLRGNAAKPHVGVIQMPPQQAEVADAINRTLKEAAVVH